MRKPIIMAALLSTLLLSSCGTTSLGTQGTGLLSGANAGTTGGAASALGSVLTNLLGGSSAVTASDLQGTWTYRKADCVFETQNLLLKAGGEMAATKIESQLESQLGKVGITPGACSFTFNSDGTYVATIGQYNLTGNYTLNTKSNTLTMTYLAGIGRISPKVVKTGASISLLFEGDKLLSMVQKVGKLSSNSTVSSLSTLINSYDGMLVGMQLSK
ncbi:MAG: DUF4923 family protein [Bacteroidales bacterium]|nr:DUF4923 family protein [Bacteroidales bacterium]